MNRVDIQSSGLCVDVPGSSLKEVRPVIRLERVNLSQQICKGLDIRDRSGVPITNFSLENG